jgi:hypothetical protein
VFVGAGFMAFFAATTLAVDVGMLMTARSQAQTAADAGALAGAVALAYNSSTDQSETGPAVQSALNTARANQVMGGQVSVAFADVTFLDDPATGLKDRVQVKVFRTAARGNAVPSWIGRIYGVDTVDISATAIAEAVPANAATCPKPFAIPDKWTEKQTAPWDSTDTFDAASLPPTFSKDLFKDASQGNLYTGYKKANVGLQMTIGPAAMGVAASAYYTLDLPGLNDIQGNIESCNASKLAIGDSLSAIAANPLQTQSGVNDLIASDSSAYWDSVSKRVISSQSPSPRVVVLPVYDPAAQDTAIAAGHNDLKITDFVGFFIESVQPNGAITGRIVPVGGLVQGGAAPSAAFARAVRLVG